MVKKVATKRSSKNASDTEKAVKNTNKTAPETKVEKRPAINILKHQLVPKHTILNKTEIDTLMAKFNISLYQLPLIKAKDPVIKLLNAKLGDIIKIERVGITKDYCYYRRVCE